MSARILITGDFCPINRIESLINENRYADIFNDFVHYVRGADLAVTNLECPLLDTGTAIKKSGPAIKSHPRSIEALRYAGFQLVTLANNHILDYGPEGVMSTLSTCQDAQIAHVGAGSSLSEARKPYFFKKDGKTIAIYNVAENEYGNTYGEGAGGNPLNPVANFYDIQEAKKLADFLFVIVHGGREHYQLPSPKVQELYRYFVDIGADAVVAHHTHCFSGYEHYKGKPIFYSLGNFVFDYKEKYQKGLWVQGYAVQFEIEDDKLSFELIPYHQGRKEDATLRLLEGDDKATFYAKIESLNDTIGNSNKLQLAWGKYLESQKLGYKGLLFVQNKYIRELIRRKLIPALFVTSTEHSLVLLNLLRCETHREIMIATLERKIRGEK